VTHNVRFTESGKPLDAAGIKAVEALTGTTIPHGYRRFLERQNGGVPEPYEMTVGKTWVGVQAFLSVGPPHDIATRHRILCDATQRRIPPEFIPIALCEGGNYLLLGLSGRYLNRVYLWDHEAEGEDSYTYENLTDLAADIDDFLDKLH
jgi:hypothetical protein